MHTWRAHYGVCINSSCKIMKPTAPSFPMQQVAPWQQAGQQLLWKSHLFFHFLHLLLCLLYGVIAQRSSAPNQPPLQQKSEYFKASNPRISVSILAHVYNSILINPEMRPPFYPSDLVISIKQMHLSIPQMTLARQLPAPACHALQRMGRRVH